MCCVAPDGTGDGLVDQRGGTGVGDVVTPRDLGTGVFFGFGSGLTARSLGKGSTGEPQSTISAHEA